MIAVRSFGRRLGDPALPLSPGDKLGPYEIVAPLGAGGMGEVYRAKDTRLGRAVAVKVLPESVSGSAEHLQRFEREARAIAALNHPNICTLHDVGRSGKTDYLVMELVEGETLAERLRRGPLPTAQVMRIGIEIATALTHAHRAGILHRDLKPSNVMLAKSSAKLMDFGLARPSRRGIGSSEITSGPTQTAPITGDGRIIGTYQYMSPEQLEGREADVRSDVWALGATLYEMATGRRAFDGNSTASVIGAIMREEPRPISELAPMNPPGLDRVVRTCLMKDPEERVQTVHDVKLQLMGLLEDGAPVETTTSPWSLRWRARTILMAMVAVMAVASAVLLMVGRAGPERPVQLSVVPPERSGFLQYGSASAISPDGRMIVFAAMDTSQVPQLWLQSLASAAPAQLKGTQNVLSAFWSPDSREIAFITYPEGKLRKISIDGSSPVTLCAAKNGRGGSWGSQGDILFAPAVQGPLFRIPEGGGELVQATWLDSSRHEASHRFPHFLPDGQHFLYASLPPGPLGFDIFVGSLGSKATRKVMTARSAVTYAEPGYLLFTNQGKLMAQRFDSRKLRLLGRPEPIADAPMSTDMDAESVASASKDGKLLFTVSGSRPELQLEWFDREGRVSRTLALPRGHWQLGQVSPDGRYAALKNGDDLWRVDLARSVPIRMVSNGAVNRSPVWSPDGAQIAFQTSRRGQEDILLVDSDGSGAPRELVTSSDLFKVPTDWTRDGFLCLDVAGDIWLAPVSGAGKARALIQTQFSEGGAKVSPDGSWIAYLSDEAGSTDIYVQAFPKLGQKVRVTRDGASDLWWMPGGDELLFRSASADALFSVRLDSEAGGLVAGEPKPQFSLPPQTHGVDLTRDGQRLLASVPSGEAQERWLRVILGWQRLVE